MTSKTFTVPNISCGHCTHTIEMEVGELTGVQAVKAEIDSKQVTVTWDDPADWAKIKDLLVEINYAPVEAYPVPVFRAGRVLYPGSPTRRH